jgi:hypothetical protein
MLPRELAYLQDRLTELDLQCKTLDTARQIKKVREDIAVRQMEANYLMERHDLSSVPITCKVTQDNASSRSSYSFHKWLDHAVADAGITDVSVADEYRSLQECGFKNCHEHLRVQLADQLSYALEQTMPLSGNYAGTSPLQDYIIEQRVDRILDSALSAEGMSFTAHSEDNFEGVAAGLDNPVTHIPSDDDDDVLIPSSSHSPSPGM